ncbi:MAG: 2-carboxy-1,4-naphthoquinone phytyltransferase [Kaiparowitsia implicata GSE-PSE-MK54-09C]|jgi:1,4-dihydroxy-2-naphthoate octaprenyltransferase|nr:2-carboxy-1,4-naphthoquinone phytyltransferase [Kaiparowitsia implicata GSE-PSE-MK54-09C]
MTLKPVPYNQPDASPTAAPSKTLWMAAIKPPMYSVAIMPIALGTAIAAYQTRQFSLSIFITFLLSAILILAWENFTNDVFDADTGIDHNKRHSLVNLTGNKPLIFWLGNLCLALGIGGIGAIALWQQSPMVLGLIGLCCVLGYLYQGPPFRLGYRGLGEVLCFFAFGPLAVEAAYYSQAQAFSGVALVASLILGVSTSLILFCSHFHQVEDDQAAGKRSPIVRLGTHRSAQLLPWLCGSVLGLTLAGVAFGWFPLGVLLAIASAPTAIKLCRHVSTYHAQASRVSNCKFIAVSFHFWSGLLLCVGFLLGMPG